MADNGLIATSPLQGRQVEYGGTGLMEYAQLALVSLSIPKGGKSALHMQLKDKFGLTPPTPTMSRLSKDKKSRVFSTTADQYFLALDHESLDACADVSEKISDSAYCTDQSDNWVKIEINGPLALAALERVCPIDLHPSKFKTNATARTVMEHMGAVVIRTGAKSFLLLSASSSAESFWHALEQSLKNVS